MKAKILLIEDDIVLGESLKNFFAKNQFEVLYSTGEMDIVDLYRLYNPDLIISDVILPHGNGFDIARSIRAINTQIPIFLMTGSEIDIESQVKGYNAGALYYILKPIVPQLLLAQINNQVAAKTERVFQLRKCSVILNERLLKIESRQLLLRDKDSLVLCVLLENFGEIVSRKQIMNSVWGKDDLETNNSLDHVISRIKRSLKLFPEIEVNTVYGKGYVLNG